MRKPALPPAGPNTLGAMGVDGGGVDSAASSQTVLVNFQTGRYHANPIGDRRLELLGDTHGTIDEAIDPPRPGRRRSEQIQQSSPSAA